MNHPLSPRERVVVRLPNWLGDVVMAEPAVTALVERARRIDAVDRLTLCGPARYLELLGARDVFALPTDAGEPSPADLRPFDVALLLTGSFRSAWTAWRARIPVRIGQARDVRGPLLTHAVRPALERGRVPFGLGRAGRWPRFLPRPFGAVAVELVHLLGVPVARRAPRVAAPALASAPFDGEPFVLANVGARPDSAKAWPAERWSVALAELAREAGCPVLCVAGPGEESQAEAVRAGLPASVRHEVRTPTLGELAALCRAARLVLSADVGPRHLAQAVGTPIVVVMGPTDPRHTDQHGPAVRVVRRAVPCGPCHRERCPLPRPLPRSGTGPGGLRHHGCMLGLTPDEVVRAARSLLL